MIPSPLTHFPDERPDELLISVLARYHRSTPHTTFMQTAVQVFGSIVPPIGDLLPSRLSSLIARLPYTDITADDLLNNATAVPYFGRFWSRDRYTWIRQQMLGPSGPLLRGRAGLIRLAPRANYCICLQCVAEDRVTFGSPHWRRVHQLPGVFVCPHHPDEILQATQVPRQPSRLLLPMVDEALDATLAPLVDEHGQTLSPWLARIAVDSHWLLHAGLEVGGGEYLRGHYTRFLQGEGLISRGRRLKRQVILERFHDHIPSELMRHLGLNSDSDTWIDRCLKGGENIAPLRHILMLLGLQTSCEELFSGANERDAKDPIFYCLNNICPSYRNKIERPIVEIAYKTSNSSNQTYRVQCPICNFVYQGKANSYNRNQVYLIRTGHLWDERLIFLASVKIKKTPAARALMVDSATLINHASRLGVTFWGEQEISKRRTPLDIEDLKSEYLALRKDFPYLSTNELAQRNRLLIGRLYRLDAQWYKANQPDSNRGVQSGSNHRKTTDWGQIDNELAQEILRIGNDLVHFFADSPPRQRIGVTQVLQRLERKYMALIRMSPHLVPKSREAAYSFKNMYNMVKRVRVERLMHDSSSAGLSVSFAQAFKILNLPLNSPSNKLLYGEMIAQR